jgi:phosphoadenosine phosphosulfate reductase
MTLAFAPTSRTDVIGEETPTELFIPWTLERFGVSNLALTTSFGMEGCALIDMYAELGAALTVIYLDTGFLFPETYALRDRLIARYPHLSFVNRGTSLTPFAQAVQHGPELWRKDPDKCCEIRKVEPMREALADVDVWVTAITRSQSKTRSETPIIHWDWQYQLLKISPLVRWDRPRIWQYIQTHDVPYNPLHQHGYPTLGCTHCTRAVPGAGVNDYSRAGRWSGTDKVECGLHAGDHARPS